MEAQKTIMQEKAKEEIPSDGEEKTENLAEAYMQFLCERFSEWSPDWCAAGQIQNPRIKFTEKNKQAEITISEKTLFSKKGRIKIIVKPVYGATAKDLDLILSSIENDAGLYHILAITGKEFGLDALQYADSFNNPNASLFLVEPAKRLLFMDEKPITKLYSTWLDSSKAPQKLKEMLKQLVKGNSGKEKIIAKNITQKFGLEEKEAISFLESCRFLKKSQDKRSFYFLS